MVIDDEQNENSEQELPVEEQAAAKAPTPSPVEALEAAQKELLYARAEFDNYKRRLLKEQEQAVKFANERFVAELSSVTDLMERAMQAAAPLRQKASGSPIESELANFILGIEMTQRELVHVLGRLGVEFIGAAGEKFDPNRHEAVSQRETDDNGVGNVLEVVQKGCVMQGRLLKPALVVVGKRAESN